MNYWLINPKNEGTSTDLSNESFDSIYMGWSADQCPKFYNDVKKGDYIIVAEGAHTNTRLHYIGKAFSLDLDQQCWHLEHSTDLLNEKVTKIINNNPNDFGGGASKNPWGPTKSIIQLTNNPAEKVIEDLINKYFVGIEYSERIGGVKRLLESNNNVILTGAPGTGKTYLAKQIAAQMILGKKYDEKTATDDEKKKMKEQCGFVQFHPSYDYTDFVEGLRPITDNNRNVGFERCDGVFKSFCKDAIGHSSDKVTQSDATKMLEWCKNNFPDHPLKSIGLRKEIPFEFKDGHIYAIASSGNKYTVNDDKIIRYLQTQEYDPLHETYVPTIGKYILDNYSDDNEKSPYIFIIDEINRGEISKIFGELFFSIDPGYRGTNGRVKTQYQNLVKKDDVFYNGFYVPENVYIIGTMNDIDRSVESMDFAFRRRFAFNEVSAKESQQMLDSDSAWGKDENGKSRKPSSEVISDIKKRMDALNDAICPDKKDSNKKGIEGLSSAYHIGASYFLKLANYMEESADIAYKKLWDNHLKGLLSEYLRGMPDAEEKLDTLGKAFGINSSDSNPS